MDSPVYQLIYVSAARQPFSDPQLKELLAKARLRNTAQGLTGLLLHERGSFLQVLEGTKMAVEGLFQKIGRDPRHHGLVRVHDGSIPARHFGSWSMGFASLPPGAAKELPGYDDFFFQYGNKAEPPRADVAQRILAAFRDGRWHASVDK